MSLTRKSFMYYFSVHVIKYESSCVSGMAPSAGTAPTSQSAWGSWLQYTRVTSQSGGEWEYLPGRGRRGVTNWSKKHTQPERNDLMR